MTGPVVYVDAPAPRPHGAASAPAFHAVVLAADRGAADPVALASGVSCKALAPVAGRALVLRVLDALAASPEITGILVCGPGQPALAGARALQARLQAPGHSWLMPRASPSASAAAAIEHLGGPPVLLTTADHALLDARMVGAFARAVAAEPWDAAVALVPEEAVSDDFPGMRRTITRLRDGGYCGANLFAFPTARGQRLLQHWTAVEARRKRPWRLVLGALGPLAVARYALGRLTLPAALETLSRRLGIRIGAVILPWGRAAVDVDSAADLRHVEAVLADPAAGTGDSG